MVRSSALKLSLVCLAAVFAAACGNNKPDDGATVGGGTGGSQVGGAGGSSAGEGGAPGTGGATVGGTGGGSFIDDGGAGGGNNCEPDTCEALGKNCGSLPDGCGSVLECGTCADGAECGIVTANVCTVLADLCVPALAEEVCAGKECGAEGDGCGNTVSCGTCPDGEGCGLQQAFQCSPILTGSDDQCPALITDCSTVGVECGSTGNGCGGTLDCGTCDDGEICGLGGPSLCGAPPVCVPFDPSEVCSSNSCGFVADGCAGTIDCETAGFGCPVGETCGGGGTAFVCGSGASSCEPLAEVDACAGIECGSAPDGCGGPAYDCGTCGAGEACFTGLCQPTNSCVPTSQQVACDGKQCGQAGNGCGETYDCGQCTGPGEVCGLRQPFQCGSNVCQQLTQQEACAGKECGIAFDGCGTAPENTFTCGTCADGTFCGLNTPFQCDAPDVEPCVPTATSCAELGWACGLAINNCGDVYDCALEGRTCNAFQICSGGNNGQPTQCLGEAPADCPLCTDVPQCPVANPTQITGRVITPGQLNTDTGNQVGVPNAFVYILRDNDLNDLPGISTGIVAPVEESCDRCEDQDLGPILTSAVSDGTGAFTLSGNIPVDSEFLLVTKIGKFRRAVRMTIPGADACKTTALPTTMAAGNPTRLPRSSTDAPTVALQAAINLPHIAITTGQIDAMECVFYKMGVASSEFGNFGSNARIHLYRGGTASGSASGARIDGSTPFDQDLYSSLTRMRSYDMVVADCEGQAWDGTAFNQRIANGANVREFVNRGGRMFASHLSFSWLLNNGTTVYNSSTPYATGLNPAATWSTSLYTDTSGTGAISVGRSLASPRIDNFSTWMVNQGVTTSPNFQFSITDPRSMATGLGSSSEEFVYRTNGNGRVQQFSFNTPYAAPQEASCGRVAYSGFHVAATGGGNQPFVNATFPTHCTNTLANNGVLTNQEKILLYMLFDLGACVGEEPEAPECTKLQCPENACGTLADGCGGQLDCTCDSGEICQNNQCIIPGCVPTSCEEEGVICSSISDGCNSVLTCDCPLCTPESQEDACEGVVCGTVSDGCSSTYLCSQCPEGCVPATTCPPNTCGFISDGCDGTLNCGGCEEGEVCGSAGPNTCGVPACNPVDCADVGAECGIIGDGCGDQVNCGPCGPGQVCSIVGGVPNQCFGCQPRTCGSEFECGIIGDGCGGTVDCGDCTGGEICGAVSPNQCDSGPPCQPQDCADVGAECGVIGDGCGDQVTCPACPQGEICGVLSPFHCDPPPACVKLTCESTGAECGIISDGCGGTDDCGECAPGVTCGLGEANKCRTIH